MPPFFEEAALMLCRMTRFGLVIEPSMDARVLIFKIAAHIYRFPKSSLTHAAAATGILDDLCSTGRVTFPKVSRAKMIALIGTILSILCRKRRDDADNFDRRHRR